MIIVPVIKQGRFAREKPPKLGFEEDGLDKYSMGQPGRGGGLNKVTEARNGKTYLVLKPQEAPYGCNIGKLMMTEDDTGK